MTPRAGEILESIFSEEDADVAFLDFGISLKLVRSVERSAKRSIFLTWMSMFTQRPRVASDSDHK